ncbi:Dps family protein [Cryptosporangium phraense]|uniref:DNA starvation/stationary phase protection protein n=1 Tax=Cryptosporangium phraense TaxID=2593070 RepID=A0A545AF60_9ACTN|nr:DNA starvation/stationary phase protection protein [Cryptosporangium phraense]TQS39967.1 DNA starvation/stationary phase protection protein [Cryptosporangium phraense]
MSTRSTALDETVRAEVGHVLEGVAIDLIALSLNLKQAHWHVHGATFKQVHEQLDEVLADVRTYSDDAAERAIALEVSIDGRPAAVAKSAVADFRTGWLDALEAVALVADEVGAVAGRARSTLPTLEEKDPISHDLVVQIVDGLEKHLWMLRAQTR